MHTHRLATSVATSIRACPSRNRPNDANRFFWWENVNGTVRGASEVLPVISVSLALQHRA